MASKAEEVTSRRLRAILVGLPTGAGIVDSDEFRDASLSLEWFLPDVLAEIHNEWAGESLDGIYCHVARKTGDLEVEILGLCWLMCHQKLTPIHLRLQLSADADEVSWLELRLGEKGPHGIVLKPYYVSEDSIYKRLHSLNGRIDTIEWIYKVTYGERRT